MTMPGDIPPFETCPVHLIPGRFCREDYDHIGLAACPEDPVLLAGAPIGQYHCPHCDCMCMAGIPHLPHDEGCALNLDVRSYWDWLFSQLTCRPGPHVRPCGDLPGQDECACGCRGDDYACWAPAQ